MRTTHPSLLLALALVAWSGATGPSWADYITTGAGPHSPYDLTLDYDALSAHQATLTVTLKNTISAPKGGLLTAFAFNNPNGDITGASLTDPHFSLIGAPNLDDGVNAAPYGQFDLGASTFGAFEGGSPKNGISPGHTGVFTFNLTGNHLNMLNEESFVKVLSEPPGDGRDDRFFVARFHGFVGDGDFGDKVPANQHFPEPATLVLAVVGGLGLLGGARRFRQRWAARAPRRGLLSGGPLFLARLPAILAGGRAPVRGPLLTTFWRDTAMRSSVLACALLSLAPALAAAAEPASPTEKGTVHFTPADDPKEVPKLYRLEARTFDYEMKWMYNLPGYDIGVHDVRFPSAVESPHPENNTVYCEYYRPEGKGPFPCVIVLDITGGDQTISRVLCTHLSRHGVAGLFVQMAYYGPRRPPGSNLRLVSPDLLRTAAGIRQTVLDLRLATAWMESRPEIDPKRLGILGTSLGSFMASLTAEMEPKLGRVALLLGGGGLVDGYYDDPRVADYRNVFELLGGSKETLTALVAPYDPITRAANLKTHKLLMLEAKNDEVVPPKMGENLWRASGEQEIHWFNSGHYTSVFYLAGGLEHIVKHFSAD